MQNGGRQPALLQLVSMVLLREKALIGEMERYHANLVLINKITEEINSGKSFDEVFNLVYENLKGIIHYNRMGVAIIKDGNTLVAKKARSDSPIILEEGYEQDITDSSLEDVIRKGEPRIINDLEEYLRKKPASESTQKIVKEGMRSSFTLPLIVKKKPIGVIFFSSKNKNNYPEKDSEYLKLIAGHIAISFERAMLIDRLNELNKMKDEYVSIVSHDLRSPLTGILLFSDIFLMEKFGNLTEKQRNAARSINRSGQYLLKLINNLLDLTKIEAGKVELNKTPGRIGDIIKESINAMLFNAHEKKIDIKLNLPEREPDINADWLKLFQVINNLIGNAIKFTKEGGNITIGLNYHVGVAEVYVADTGVGIASEDIPFIFDRFRQVKSKATKNEYGNGLGLAICKNLVELHCGKIWAESAINRGTTVYFTIPAS